MVATRRGVRACSPSKTNPDIPADVQATPSTGRRTRRTAKQSESPTHSALMETSSQLEKCEGEPHVSPPTSLLKRCTRASRLHSPEQPCTPVDSIHEADQSDVDSCCSVESEVKKTKTRARRRSRAPCTVSQEDEVSEVESCSSAVSAPKAGQSVRRSTRKKTNLTQTDQDQVKGSDVKVDSVPESESCSSAVSEFQRVTRSQRKASSRSSAKQQTEDSELSDVESCTSSISEVSKSDTRRSTRSRRRTGPIPVYLDEASESSLSPAPTTRRTRAAKGKAAAAVDVSEPQSCDSEGFESGPTYSNVTRKKSKPGLRMGDSDSEPTEVHSPVSSPCSTRGRGTPCSSRTGSGSSTRGSLLSKYPVKDLTIVLEKAPEPAEEETPLQDSILDSTVIAEDADCTVIEEDTEDKNEEGVSDLISVEEDVVEVEKEANADAEEDPVQAEEAGSKSAVTVDLQQEEPCAESKPGDTSEMETMQETEPPSSELLEPSVTVTLCERTPEITEETEDKDEAMETADVDAHLLQTDEVVDETVVVETGPSEEGERVEEMEVSTLNGDNQQVVDSSEVESTQATSSGQHAITPDSVSVQPKDVTVQKTKVISLLESSEEESESDEEEAGYVSEEEEEEDLGSRTKERAGKSVEGLFMIDTRPGEEADEHYYKERQTEDEERVATGEGDEQGEEEEDEEEFVDEAGDEDDDEDAMILFSSRNPNLKEMSSRIDPGIRMKELGGLYINFDGSKSKPVPGSLQKLKEKKTQDEVMKKSVMGPEFEKKDAVPPYSESKQAVKLKRRAEREKTTGDGWFNMKAPELTQELKGDLQVLKMRGAMDPKRFYKKNDRDGFPKYFQIGTVVDNPVDFYHSRIPKKERKRTMVEELMADAEFRHNNKKKYQNIMAEKAAQGAGKRFKKSKFYKKK
ncbi:deoxynucleotidyltransferase terminal-interacting protein 2 [Xyrichtys novacula]|uniref:Deoxynucleotidyltransferase terminal-interacting protein 2 n=1 Tax=Xyrichtys novacula TaxID=13765 RepID=A0AAV1FHM5_XYRNO|nr:deoxynucleotidyltransferase terminal-interacting protein 2 [Xyrichtys novacula]